MLNLTVPELPVNPPSYLTEAEQEELEIEQDLADDDAYDAAQASEWDD